MWGVRRPSCRTTGKNFWLGYISRTDFDAALATRSQNDSPESEIRASVTIDSRRHGWLVQLGASVHCFSFPIVHLG